MLNKNHLHKYINLRTIIWLAYVFVLVLGTKKLCDRYCFDAFIYRKNNFLARQYGYKEENGNLCRAQLNSDGFRERQLSPKKEGEYLILVVGDSVVYGQGLLKSQRFTEILEKKLTKIRPTRVLNLGICGTNLYQHYITSEMFRETLHADLIVMGFTENDLLVWKSMRNYPPELKDEGNIVYDIKLGEENEYVERVLGSFNERSMNFEMLDYIAPLIPKEGTFFISFHYLWESNDFQEKLMNAYSIFQKNDLRIINSVELYNDKYRKPYQDEFMGISKKELHPNGRANQMFAERLFQEITTNKSFKF